VQIDSPLKKRNHYFTFVPVVTRHTLIAISQNGLSSELWANALQRYIKRMATYCREDVLDQDTLIVRTHFVSGVVKAVQ
jgi:hypothetical protein